MRSRITAALATALIVSACADRPDSPQFFEVPLYSIAGHDFSSFPRGSQEVPANASRAAGALYMRLNEDGTRLAYKLVVGDINNVTQAHIHCGPAGVNGPIVVWLYPSAPPAVLIPGNTTGVLNEFTATAADVIARPDSPACPGGVANLGDVVAKLRNGGAYANVHTTAFPPGEIRDQVHVR
jgi:hypothetical protein